MEQKIGDGGMNAQYTPGRLLAVHNVLLLDDGIGEFKDIASLVGCANAEANARRLVACWNALLDAPTELLEQAVSAGITDVSMGNLFSSRMELQAQRDELLVFVHEVCRIGDTRLANMAIAVIAKVKGEKQ